MTNNQLPISNITQNQISKIIKLLNQNYFPLKNWENSCQFDERKSKLSTKWQLKLSENLLLHKKIAIKSEKSTSYKLSFNKQKFKQQTKINILTTTFTNSHSPSNKIHHAKFKIKQNVHPKSKQNSNHFYTKIKIKIKINKYLARSDR